MRFIAIFCVQTFSEGGVFMIRKFLAFILMFALVMSFGTAHADSVTYIDADRTSKTCENYTLLTFKQHGRAGTSQAKRSTSPGVLRSTAKHTSFSLTAHSSQSLKVSRSTRTTASPFTASQQTLERSRLTALLRTLQVSAALTG